MIKIPAKVIYGPDGVTNIFRSGYGQAGASKEKRALKAFNAKSNSAVNDIDRSNHILRPRSRMLYMASPVATSAIRTNRTNVVGSGLKLKSRIKREVLGISSEEAAAKEKQIEMEFNLWGGNKRACDATGVNDFYAMQQLALMSWLMSGDVLVPFKFYEPTELFPYSLRLHIVEADRVSTPPMTGRRKMSGYIDGEPINFFMGATEGISENGNRIHDGVEVDKNGSIIAYYICSEYPVDQGMAFNNLHWTRVEAYGEQTGLPNILHIMDAERPDQYRGVPYLAHVIEPLLQLRRYTESELQAATIESFFTAFIKTETGGDMMPYNEIGESISSDPDDYEMGPGTINVMRPGESIELADPKRPASGFDSFIHSISEQIGAALEIPTDLLLKSFNASYSASRAALLEAWKSFKMRREWFVSDFCRPVYERWFFEAVALGRIEAKGFFDDPLIRAAWLGSDWIGPSQGQLDPTKEITAAQQAIQEGLSTRDQETIKLNGGSWADNIEQLAKERELMLNAGLIDGESAPLNPIRTINTDEGQEVSGLHGE